MADNNNDLGVYVMQVAATLTGMHPQTLRKYERAGFLMPSRRYMVRMYSDEDIARLRMIKHLVDDVGLNLAGVELALKLRDKLLDMKEEITSAGISRRLGERLTSLLDDMLEMLGNY
jgi:MerR family transcriptional regulator/heat shock protein HspR